MRTAIKNTQKVGGLVSASEIIKAGGPTAWAKKTGYDSSKIKMSGIIKLTNKEFENALKSLKN
jgi:hypothetical protein